MRSFIPILLGLVLALPASAQQRSRLPDVSTTIKGDLVLPVPLSNPLFTSVTENIGQVGAAFQVPIRKGFGVGAGGAMWWTTLKERALAPFVGAGDVRRTIVFGKLQYERYTGERTFYEVNFRSGMAFYDFDCPSCVGAKDGVLYWGGGVGYYVHATDNLAFGLTLGYDRASATFSAQDLGLTTGFPGRRETMEGTAFQNLLFGLGFSTRLRRSERDPVTW